VFRLKDVRGLHYIAHLLHHPHHEFHALELVTVEAGTHLSRPSDAGEVLDAKARAAYKRRLEDLRAELEEAQAYNDLGRMDKAMQEMEFLTAELATAVGLQGRSRKVAAHAERARVSVTRRITVARQKIAAHSPALERYLAMTIKTGLFCSYTPHLHFLVSWQF
jgi:non-specific serine/threonine protein kinase